jgi:hypothetical protein
MYFNAADIIPVMGTLRAKGAGLGTVLALTMTVAGLSLPEGTIPRKVLKPKLIAVSFGVVGGEMPPVGSCSTRPGRIGPAGSAPERNEPPGAIERNERLTESR